MFMNFLRNWGYLSGVSYHVFRLAGVCATHGIFAPITQQVKLRWRYIY